jgi:hypothetical protein
MPLNTDQAALFFGSLYDNSATPDLSEFESAAIRLVARTQGISAPADKALGLLMLNHVMTTPPETIDAATKGALTAAVLMNIKAPAVDGFLRAFPQENLQSLIGAATEAGYQVEVLPPERANAVPRTVLSTGGAVFNA